MEIKKFKLIAKGTKGLSAETVESSLKKTDTGEITVNDNVIRERNTPLSFHLLNLINRMKYPYLILTGRWNPDWSKYMNPDWTLAESKDLKDHQYGFCKKILDDTFITGISHKSGGLVITGSVRVMGHKQTTSSTPFIDENDSDFGLFDQMIEEATVILREVVKFLQDDRLQMADAKQYLIDFFGQKEEQKARVAELSEEDAYAEQISIMESKGYIVISPSDAMPGMETDPNPFEDENVPAPEAVDSTSGKGVVILSRDLVALPGINNVATEEIDELKPQIPASQKEKTDAKKAGKKGSTKKAKAA